MTEATVTQADEAAAISAWNGIADEFNQWGNLSDAERVHWLEAFARHREAHSTAASQASDAGEDALASVVVKLSAIRTVLREAHFALDDSEDLSHLDEPVHAVPLDNVMRLHRALKACERFAPKDESWEGPGPLVTQIIEWLGGAFDISSTPDVATITAGDPSAQFPPDEVGPNKMGTGWAAIAAQLREISRISNAYDLREAIEGHDDAIGDSHIWRDLMDQCDRLATLSPPTSGDGQ